MRFRFDLYVTLITNKRTRSFTLTLYDLIYGSLSFSLFGLIGGLLAWRG